MFCKENCLFSLRALVKGIFARDEFEHENRFLPIGTRHVLLMFGNDIQWQTKGRVQKPKNPIWLPGSQCEIDFAEESISN